MVTVLRKEYPEIADIIAERIKKTLPEEKLDDLCHISEIVETFKRDKGICLVSWTNRKSNYNRELLIAVMLMFYHPEKLLQLTTSRSKFGMLKQLSKLIGSSQPILSGDLANAIVAFKAYDKFRKEVYRIYEIIKTENNFFTT
ncbi:hypothetical protein ATK78_1323 [Pedobacter metabolipauper]|uniref:Uncharacterized protein n=2 Tax=Pedobacter metabolipauper TaxID=425513 RepID=A0A4R6T262_9SPHI|nr:hypothetical protein ATK78_1323 [Pedobacter metabolipauper]